MTILAFLTTSRWDPRQTLADSTLEATLPENRAEQNLRVETSHSRGESIQGFYTLKGILPSRRFILLQ